MALMRAVALREHLSAAIARLERRLGVLAREEREPPKTRGRSEVEAWLAFLLLVVIVAGAGVWLGVATRALRPPAQDCTEL